jgi:hypothetical protein
MGELRVAKEPRGDRLRQAANTGRWATEKPTPKRQFAARGKLMIDV